MDERQLDAAAGLVDAVSAVECARRRLAGVRTVAAIAGVCSRRRTQTVATRWNVQRPRVIFAQKRTEHAIALAAAHPV